MSDDPRSKFARDNALYAGIAAVLLLYFGFGVNNSGVSDSQLYNASVDVSTWAMKIGGIGLALVTVLGAIGYAPILLADALLSAAVGFVFAACGLIWLLTTGDWEGALFIVFGVMFVSSARHCWSAWRSGAPFMVDTPPPPRILHPAEIHPDVLPKSDEPPPAEGYLAALAREKRAASRADHE